MLKEFKAFIMRGNVLDLAIAVIIGAAFGKIVTSLTDDVLMPVIGKIFGGLDFSSYFWRMGPVPANYAGSLSDYAALKKAGVPLLGYGAFATQLVNFVIVAGIIFMILRVVNRTAALIERETARLKREEEATPVAPAPEPVEIALLREIRDELKARG
ncbi:MULTISPECIES: large conductance mechanosensitive channel protein MscL [Sphingomonas]|jgi:large conductance mechanosensitive channel|uniref:Large-conductance mechanosensitive channel n=2 Tax=Sphingomonas aurantiaca TaxID=185949 RepID=A0A2T5GTJ7_9SPHN|nr:MULTISPECIES: large conductance mechanosensitive channel protein MscL [Sphingomonas]KQN15759.1 mechanosensitive ion channel protein MscL [Sphingomonas sp. Leaf28]KQN27714.1 mechanosensitive ion channel protein MscL [Sphingomonas sp. Leaf38]PTQ62646.1 large conductance mechanosensitive channel [Sphingomonas aurantiaca]RZT56598.1 large conductance mechanosensitive channel [Sphingomonas sp. BK036]